MNRSDGWGIARLRESGVPVVVLSTEINPVVAARCQKLGIEYAQGLAEKSEALAQLALRLGIDLKYVAYVGNDVNDLTCLRMVGLPVAVRDAHPRVLQTAKLVLTCDGGHGAVREMCDLILEHRKNSIGEQQRG